ncbi:MAG: aldo/keto reductase, partial [Alphaproteobacteria bacterium]
MKRRFLGPARLEVSAIGYGCPPFAGKLGAEDEAAAIAVIHRAIECGITLIDTADHGGGNNEDVLAKALRDRRHDVVLTSKFGNMRSHPERGERMVDGRPEYVAKACNAS